MASLREMIGTHEKHSVFQPTGGVKDNRSPIIFLHAMLCSRKIWKDIPLQIAELTGRKVFTYDARSHGANKNLADFNFDNLVQDLITFMEDQRIRKTILVGHSMGGKTAITLALNAPEIVEKVIIVDMHVSKIPNYMIMRAINFLTLWRNAVQSLPATTPVGEVTNESVPILYSLLAEEERLESERRGYLASDFEYSRLQNGKYDVAYNAVELRSGLEKYMMEYKGEIERQYEGPAYFFYGSASPYEVDKKVDTIKEYFPGAELIRFEGAPHHIFVHSPREFTRILAEKINQRF